MPVRNGETNMKNTMKRTLAVLLALLLALPTLVSAEGDGAETITWLMDGICIIHASATVSNP